MTEAEWLGCTDSMPLLEYLRTTGPSDRKLRLFLCAGCRHLCHLFHLPWSFTAVKVAERFADGQATQEELDRAEYDAEATAFGYDLDNETWPHTDPERMKVVPRLVEIGALPESVLSGGEWEVDEVTKRRLIGAASLADWCACPGLGSYMPRWMHHIPKVDWPCRWLVDCIFGNPFRPVSANPGWLVLNGGTVLKLVQTIYDSRRFQDLPRLADALEEAGCANADILNHCRSEGPHVRGCWVVDLVLGKE